ncbi:hypothetical protein M513_04475 [Trichuris suis]|uniref:Reverse transcriptase domain-containing protein n=1 Tax=Trichuris suis TaxID=68888 RepID=A0A085MC29_9BILA|nr:hypothetical protein M513_04475 [Trichuris suis]
MKRFISLRKRISADDELRSSYAKAISELIHLGIARKVEQKELRLPAGRIWYLPHHGVRHPARPNKVRIVFDASSVCEGVSLNSCLRKGPDLLNDLIPLLIQFRRFAVPVIADVERMFHQVQVPLHDQSFLRFPWTEGDEAPQTFQMTRQVFGLRSGPASCQYLTLFLYVVLLNRE